MSELVAVDKEALDRAIRYLRGHASFKRSGHHGVPSKEGAEQIESYAKALEKHYPVRVDLAQSPKACEVGQHVWNDTEGVCIYCETPMS